MRRVVSFYLIGLIFFILKIRTLDSPYMFLLEYLVVFCFILFIFALLFINTLHTETFQDNSLHCIERCFFKVVLVASILISYGTLLSVFGGCDLNRSIKIAGLFLPIGLFPVFAYAFPEKKDWILLFFIMVIEGFISALIDLYAFQNMQENVVRLMSEEFSSIDHFYALITAILLLLLYPFPWKISVILFASLPFLLYRMFLAISRGEAVFLFLTLIYGIIISLFVLKKGNLKKIAFLASLFMICLIFYKFMGMSGIVEDYTKAYQFRAEKTEDAAQLRWIEFLDAIKYGGFLGTGWATEGDFSNVFSSSYLPMRYNVHNMIGYIIWKFGFIIGCGIIVSSLIYLIRQFYVNVYTKDTLGFVISGLFIVWFLHAMVNTYYMRADLNIWVAAWLGYFYRRNLWIHTTSTEKGIHNSF
ncbi:MAG: hypothetical protein JETT_3674 [Candidatus Jettenia ecosi]|uniref:Uncharacterized protein n=1 Tax=Candidatus Jettenia ecosi TaxID=2494326 RepID=A0A533QHM0_9BACT|nr:MAG: hypothetical protein JETT_3674 [Candidatus Jettenia ecosi]